MSSHPTDDTPEPTPPNNSRPPRRELRPTPRSAPAVAFLEVTEDTAEVTEIPPPKSGSRLPLIIAAIVVVVVAGVFWLIRMSAGVGSDQAGPIAVDSLGGGNMFAAATSSIGGGSFVAQAEVAPTQPSDAVNRYVNAVAHGSIDSLVAVAPGLTPEQRSHWEKDVFDRAALIEASVEMGSTVAAEESAVVDFVIALKVLDRTTKKDIASRINQHATLVKQGGVWQITSIR